MSIYERLKELAHDKNITIAEIERKTSISNGTIGKFVKQNPSLETLNKLAEFFNVSLDYLVGREEATPKKFDINNSTVFITFNGTELSKKERAVILATAQALIEQRESE